jgi:hypothetical protein
VPEAAPTPAIARAAFRPPVSEMARDADGQGRDPIRADVIEKLVWVLEHCPDDVDPGLRGVLFTASSAEFDVALDAFASRAQQRNAEVDALQAEIERRLFGQVPDDASELDDPPPAPDL